MEPVVYNQCTLECAAAQGDIPTMTTCVLNGVLGFYAAKAVAEKHGQTAAAVWLQSRIDILESV